MTNIDIPMPSVLSLSALEAIISDLRAMEDTMEVGEVSTCVIRFRHEKVTAFFGGNQWRLVFDDDVPQAD